MLLRFFRSTSSQMVIFLPFLAILLWLHPLLANPQVTFPFDNHTMPFYHWISGIIPEGSVAGILLSIALVLIQGLLLVRLNSKFIFINNRTYLPALFYFLLSAAIPSIQRLNPILFAGIFFLLAFEKVFDAFRREKLAYEIFNASFYISISSLFYPYAILLIILVWIGLVNLRPFIWREWVFTILGLMVPYFILSGYYDIVHNDPFLIIRDFAGSFELSHPYFSYHVPLVILLSYIFLLWIFASQFLLKSYQNRKIMQRKAFTLFFWLFFCVAGIYIFIPQVSVEILFLLALPLSFLLANYFALMRSLFWGSIYILILLILIVWNQLI